MGGAGRYRSVEDDGPAHMPHLWTRRPAWALSLTRALSAVRDLLAPLRNRAAAATAAAAGPTAAPLCDLRTARAGALSRTVQCLLPVLAPARVRAPRAPVAATWRMMERVCRICGRDCAPRQHRAGRCPMCAMYWR